MPPKGKKVVEEEADTTPVVLPPTRSMSDPRFIAEIMKCVGDGDLTGAMAKIVRAVNRNNRVVELQSSILTDTWFDNVAFAVERGWAPEKATGFLADMGELMELVRGNGDLCELSTLLRKILVDYHKNPAKDPALRFSVDDIAAIAEHATAGIIQHYRLYRLVFTRKRVEPETYSKTVPIVLPISPRPLRAALSLEQHHEHQAQKKVEREQRLTALREQAAAARAVAAEQAAREAAEASQRQKEQDEEEAANVKLDDESTQAILDAMKCDLDKALQHRHEALLERIAQLEGGCEPT
eukprot:TRINITY_DN7638_c0_g1_i1.p1 TRINITY_DN7638_c0_g1~~TRINITY_DN7638_c0_g1_i1.p1  ORF type:complete len:296 (+),score=99.73 TRINITY_DN7638_c0_g1_i1:59-946(+)